MACYLVCYEACTMPINDPHTEMCRFMSTLCICYAETLITYLPLPTDNFFREPWQSQQNVKTICLKFLDTKFLSDKSSAKSAIYIIWNSVDQIRKLKTAITGNIGISSYPE